MNIKLFSLHTTLIFFTTFIASINGMNHIQIIEPYVPGANTNYHLNPIGIRRSLHLVMGLTDIMPSGTAHALKAGLLLTVPKRTSDVIDTLLTNPVEILNNSWELYNRWHDLIVTENTKTRDDLQFLEIVENLTQKYKQQFPLFSLRECPSPCNLARATFNKRTVFEDKVASALVDKIAANPSPVINYASFGCGGMFSDLLIALQTLIQKPDAQITFHVIDLYFNIYVTAKKLINNSQSKQNFDMQRLFEENRSSFPNRTFRQFVTSFKSAELLYNQFTEWLRYTFPKATLQTHMYKSFQDYCDHIRNKQTSWPDFVVAADIDDTPSRAQKSLTLYSTLCVLTLRNNPDAYTLMLESLGLTTVSLKKIDGTSIPVEATNGDVLGYITTEEIVA